MYHLKLKFNRIIRISNFSINIYYFGIQFLGGGMMRVQVPHNIPILEIIREFTKVMGIDENKCRASIIDMNIAVDYLMERRIGIVSKAEYDKFKNFVDDHTVGPNVELQIQPHINALGIPTYAPAYLPEENPYVQNYVQQVPLHPPIPPTQNTTPVIPHNNRNRFFENTEYLHGSTPGVTVFPRTFILSDIELPTENGILDIIYAPHSDEVHENFCKPFGQNICPFL